jgi:hypothetical protein
MAARVEELDVVDFVKVRIVGTFNGFYMVEVWRFNSKLKTALSTLWNRST